MKVTPELAWVAFKAGRTTHDQTQVILQHCTQVYTPAHLRAFVDIPIYYPFLTLVD
jgi:hypothetical protein